MQINAKPGTLTAGPLHSGHPSRDAGDAANGLLQITYNWQSGGDSQVPAVGVRRLTPRECERLQGFPDDWTLYRTQNGERVEQSDSARYRQLGNAVSVPVAVWIAQRIAKEGTA